MRNRKLIRQWRILCRLLGAFRPLSIEAFEDIRVEEQISLKTLRRDLAALVAVSEFQLEAEVRDSGPCWALKSRDIFRPTKVPRAQKRCSKCGKDLSMAEFHAASSSADGRRSRCIACEAAIKKANNVSPEVRNRIRREWYRNNRRRISKERRENYAMMSPEQKALQQQRNRDYYQKKKNKPIS